MSEKITLWCSVLFAHTCGSSSSAPMYRNSESQRIFWRVEKRGVLQAEAESLQVLAGSVMEGVSGGQ